MKNNKKAIFGKFEKFAISEEKMKETKGGITTGACCAPFRDDMLVSATTTGACCAPFRDDMLVSATTTGACCAPFR